MIKRIGTLASVVGAVCTIISFVSTIKDNNYRDNNNNNNKEAN